LDLPSFKLVRIAGVRLESEPGFRGVIFGRELMGSLEWWWSGGEWSGDFPGCGSFVPSLLRSQPPCLVHPTNETYDMERGAHVFSLASLLLFYILSLSLSTCTARGIAWHSMELLLLPWGLAVFLPPRLKSYVPVHTPVGKYQYVSM
jgi:hypothetical protein